MEGLLRIYLLAILVCLGYGGSTPEPDLVAVYSSSGVTGVAQFTQDTAQPGVKIRVSLRGGLPREVFRWGIYELPPMFDSGVPCSKNKLGKMIKDLTADFGYVASEQEMSFTSSKLKLTSTPDAIVGRALVFKSVQTGRFACSSLALTTITKTYAARLHYPLAGIVYLRQSGHISGIFSKLYWVNGTRKDVSVRWALDSLPGSPSLEELYQMETTQCKNSRPLPFFQPADFSGHLNVGKDGMTSRAGSYKVISNLPNLESSVRTLHLFILDAENPDHILACAKLNSVKPKHAVAGFGNQFGEVIFHQASPMDPSLVLVKFDHLPTTASNFKINEYSLRATDKVCPMVTQVYNPQNIRPEDIPPTGYGSVDQFPVGDLGGKYGSLSGMTNVYRHLIDPSLSLFGIHSVVGRALVLYHKDGRPMACTNIHLPGSMVTTKNVFTKPIHGYLTMTQPANNPLDDTYLDIEVCWDTDEVKNATIDHLWHVHANALELSDTEASTECAAAGTHYNPYNVDVKGTYGCHCSAATPFRCESGDLAARQGPLAIPPCSKGVSRYRFTDTNIALSGPAKAAGHSVVIHKQNYELPRIICSNVVTVGE